MILACLLVAAWLLCGAGLRTWFAIFDRIYVPPSVIAGFVGLACVQSLLFLESSIAYSIAATGEVLRGWPGTLIAVVFAGMLLPGSKVAWKQSAGAAGREALMVWIIVLGQTAIGLTATWLLIKPFYDLPASFGMLLETGFAGGHGTAAAMGQVFASPQIHLAHGLDLGLLMATIGLVYGTLSGIFWINLAARWGWIDQKQSVAPERHDTVRDGREKDRSDFARGLDPLLVQSIWLSLAFAVGMGLQSIVSTAAQWSDSLGVIETTPDDLVGNKVTYAAILGSFPLFIYTMLGGWIVRHVLKRFGASHLIDGVGISRLTSIAMDLLVVAAIATLNLTAVVALVIPFSILVLCGMVWTGVCLMILSKRILPETHWFQLGLVNYGMSTGTTATGFILLRIVDPELKTGAAKDYALAAPFSAPFIGGGMLTIGLPLLVLEKVPIAISSGVLLGIVSVLIVVGIRIGRRGDD